MTTDKPLRAQWNYPTQIFVGAERYRELPQLCMQQGMRRPLLVTDPGLVALPFTHTLVDLLRNEGVEIELFSQIRPNPVGENVEQGVQHFHDGHHDGVIALGGGSAMDAAKAIALMVGQTRPLWDFEDVGDNWTRVNTEGMARVIAIPTTAGTGSEVGRASVITHAQQARKVIIFHPAMLPELVILDPVLTQGLPPHLTAATGMDALSHCLEAYCARSYHPMAEGIAIEGMRLIQQYLPRAYADGADLAARTQMLVASSMGATAFQRGLGGMHALAHALGALYDAHHGLLNAILMPYVLKANLQAIGPQLTLLAQCLTLPQATPESVLEWILALRTQLQIPHSLHEINIPADAADKVAQLAFNDPSAGGNPIALSVDQYRALFEAAHQGALETLQPMPLT